MICSIDIEPKHGIFDTNDKMAGKTVIDAERCKGCGLCVAVCPNKTIVISTISNKNGYLPAQTDSRDCTGCAACAIVCPEAIIKVFRESSGRVIVAIDPGSKDKPGLIKEKV